MGKIKVLLLHIVYPFSISKYWKIALKKNPNIDLKDAGVYTGSWIPWMGGMNLPDKYAEPPDYVLPNKPGTGILVNYELVMPQLPKDWIPDIVLTVNAGIEWRYKPQHGIVVSVATDSHCLDYSHSREIADHFFNMHPAYSMPQDKLLHYAFSPDVHYPMSDIEKDTDAVLIGMPYQQRMDWVNRLTAEGVSVTFQNRPVFDEYRELANRARIGLNWSSMDDTNARFFETMAMNLCLVTNRTPDIASYGFEEDKHFLGFGTLNEAVDKVLWAKNNPDWAKAIANSSYQKVTQENWTYDKLVKTVLKECGYE